MIRSRFNVTDHFVDRHLAEGRGDRIALWADDGPCSYAELAERVNRIGNVLLDAGVQAGQRVLICVDDSVELVAAWYAVLKVGAVTAEVYTFLAAKDLAYYLRYTGAEVAVVEAGALERFRSAAAEAPALRRTLVVREEERPLADGEASLASLERAAPAELTAAPTGADDVAIWKFTTGSTGRPKACVHPMRAPLLSSERYGQQVLGIREEDVVLPVPKLFFGYARDMTALYPFAVGGAGIVFRERTTASLVFALIARYRPTILVNVPTMVRAMLDDPAAERADLSCLRLATSAGEALPGPLLDRWNARFGVETLDGIGSSEAYHIYASNRPGDVRAGSVGREVPGYRARIVGADGAELPAGDVGRLWIEGPTAALEYHDAPAKTAETFAGDLVMTGDLFRRDEDGRLWYAGRADDLLKVGGIWVAPAEIEASLREHPGVVDCAVVGQDVEGLQRTLAYVVAAEGLAAGDELGQALQAHVKQRLSPHKYPREVRFLGELPKTGSGKVDRAALRARSAAPRP